MIINMFARKLKLNKQGRERCFFISQRKGEKRKNKAIYKVYPIKTEKWRIGICWYVLLNGMANNFRLLHGCFSFKYGRNDSHQNIFDSKSRYLQWKKKHSRQFLGYSKDYSPHYLIDKHPQLREGIANFGITLKAPMSVRSIM